MVQLEDFLSLNEAVEYLGVSRGTFKNHVYVTKIIIPAVQGSSIAFTKEQLDRYAVASDTLKIEQLQKNPIRASKEAEEQAMTFAEVAEYLGISKREARYLTEAKNPTPLPYRVVGRASIMLKRDIEHFKQPEV